MCVYMTGVSSLSGGLASFPCFENETNSYNLAPQPQTYTKLGWKEGSQFHRNGKEVLVDTVADCKVVRSTRPCSAATRNFDVMGNLPKVCYG